MHKTEIFEEPKIFDTDLKKNGRVTATKDDVAYLPWEFQEISFNTTGKIHY